MFTFLRNYISKAGSETGQLWARLVVGAFSPVVVAGKKVIYLSKTLSHYLSKNLAMYKELQPCNGEGYKCYFMTSQRVIIRQGQPLAEGARAALHAVNADEQQRAPQHQQLGGIVHS